MVFKKLNNIYPMHANNDQYKSYAKINLGLQILERLPDNYHQIYTIMQEIDFYDCIEIQKKQNIHISLETHGPINVPEDSNNLCIKAAELIYKNYNINHGIHITLNKNIPTGSGLGGGSSNAAYILRTLNNLFNLDISNHDLHQFAFQLGCDVPFFINGGVQLAEGKGEKLSVINLNLSKYIILLVIPTFQMSTKKAYNFFKNNLPKTIDSYKFRTFQNDIDWSLFENDFESVVNLTYPEVGSIRKILEMEEALFVSLSGSGSTMFGVFDDLSKANVAKQALKSYDCHIVKPINKN
tara:strand:- start:99 stop:986 length:888 start_codon:yes stop_codon:yes gene_type:complete